MNVTVKMRKENQSFDKQSFDKVMLFYAGFWLRLWFWPFSGRRTILINRDEVIQVEVVKKQIINESNASVRVT